MVESFIVESMNEASNSEGTRSELTMQHTFIYSKKSNLGRLQDSCLLTTLDTSSQIRS
jgi:hypothetical protein